MPELPTQEACGRLQRLERLTRLVAIADDRDEDLAETQVVGHLNVRHRNEAQPRILQLLRYQGADDALDFVVNASQSLTFHLWS
jgi:hypothetical protein